MADSTPSESVKIIECESPGGAAQVYSNHLVLSWTAFDVQVRFSHFQRLPADEPTSRLEHRATVTLAWAEAKALLMQLSDVIQRYEAANETALTIPKLP